MYLFVFYRLHFFILLYSNDGFIEFDGIQGVFYLFLIKTDKIIMETNLISF